MKRLYILLTLLVAAATHLAAQTGYQPLVREGVRWICFDFASNYEDGDEFQIYSYEFIGDSILYQNKFGTRFRYKRLYQKNLYSIHRDTNQQLSIEDVAQSKPKLVSLMRESGKKI